MENREPFREAVEALLPVAAEHGAIMVFSVYAGYNSAH
jgi:hypothetical protein